MESREQHAFDALKKAITEEPVLSLPDLNKPFELHTDASDHTIGGVLMQDGHPITLKAKSLMTLRGNTRSKRRR